MAVLRILRKYKLTYIPRIIGKKIEILYINILNIFLLLTMYSGKVENKFFYLWRASERSAEGVRRFRRSLRQKDRAKEYCEVLSSKYCSGKQNFLGKDGRTLGRPKKL